MKKIALILHIFVTLIVLSGFSYASELKIMLKDSAVIGKKTIVLEDIADFKGDKEEWYDLKEISIGKAPTVGQKRAISAEYINLKLKQQGVDTDSIVFAGSSSVQILRRTRLLEAEAIVDLARDYVMENIPWDADDVIVDAVRMPKDLLVADTDINYEVIGQSSIVRAGPITIIVKVATDKNEFTKVPVSLKIRRFSDVVVSKRVIERGEIINLSDVYLRREEVVTQIQDALFKVEDVVGKRAKMRIKDNYVVLSRMFDIPPVVKSRSIVTLVYETNSMRIVTKVQAKNDGRVGDIINVMNVDTRKVFPAQVIDAGLVKYIL